MRIDYVLKRLGFLVLVVWTAATVNFVLPRLSGQDPVRQRLLKQVLLGSSQAAGIEEFVKAYDIKFGLDKPMWQQYLTYVGDLARFDLGQSITRYPRQVREIIGKALPWTAGLMTVSTLLAFVAGSLLGALVAWPRSPRWVRFIAAPIMTFSSIPYYLMGLILLFVFAFRLRWLPGHGGYAMSTIPSRSWSFALEVLKHHVLPTLSIVLSAVGFWALGMRGMMVTVQGEDYMTLAEAKGLTGRRLFFRYGLRNALLPQFTSLALSMGYVLAGSVLVEVVFGLPGVGSVLFNAIQLVDYPLIQGIVFTIIVGLAVATLAVDMLLPVLDPRIRRGGRR